MRSDNLWNLEREWREINYLFHRLEEFKIIKNDKRKKIPYQAQIFGDNEKLKEIEYFTEYLAKENNKKNADDLFYKLGISYRPPTRMSNEDAKEILMFFCDHNIIDPSITKWIHQGNIDLINYLWSYLTMANVISDSQLLYLPKFYHLKSDDVKSSTAIPNVSLDKQVERNILPYRKLKLDKTPASTEEKYKSIMKFIDLWSVEPHIKKQQIKIFENRWLSIKNKNKMHQWLNKNSDLNDWSWSFIKSNFLNNKTPYWVPDIDNMNVEARNKEIGSTLITLYNLIEAPEAKALMMASLSRAASQYRYRKKSKKDEKSYINVVISNENKSDFDELKNRLRMNSEDTLSYLIGLGIKNTHARKIDVFKTS